MTERPRRVALVGADLMGRSRVEEAVTRAGMELVAAPPAGGIGELDADLVVVDLDSVGAELVRSWGERSGPAAIGYFSHVDTELGEAARAAGIEALPRGRFWRTLPDVLALLERPEER